MIRMTKLSDYGLVLLTHFARNPERPGYSAMELAAFAQLPLPTVTKILKTLARDGLLVSHRGSKGGYSLARPAAAITVTEIVEALEGPISLTECVDETQHHGCGYEAQCPTRGNWHRINGAIRLALSGITLEELATPVVPLTAPKLPLECTSPVVSWGGNP